MPTWLVLYLAANGGLTVAAVLFERYRYRPTLDRSRGRWQPTGERFVDPTSGKMIEVHYNEVTGERDYVETNSTR